MLSFVRRFLPVLTLACLVAVPFTSVGAAESEAAAPAFQEGKDYGRLSTPVPVSVAGKQEVLEFFSYRCPHCYRLEPVVKEWRQRQPDTVIFTQIPVHAGYAPNYELAARAFYTAQNLGVADKLHSALFEAMQQGKLDTEAELAEFFGQQGVTAADFQKTYSSFQTETQLRRAAELAQRYGVRGVPAVIVNGQYDIRSPKMFEVVDFLLAKPAVAPQG